MINRYAQIKLDSIEPSQVISILSTVEVMTDTDLVLVDRTITEHDWFSPEKGFINAQPYVELDKDKYERLIREETQWRDAELSKALNRIDQYEKDQGYAVELRTSPFTAQQYNLLLQDRKLLSDYPSVDNFPFVERPVLSGLV